MTADESKQIDLVAFLERHYELSFRSQGAQWVALTPFSAEQPPSVVVRCRQGHSGFDHPSTPGKGSVRFETSYARALYQTDGTSVSLQGVPSLYLVNVVDDDSRFCGGSELCRDQGSESLAAVLTDQRPSFFTVSAPPAQFQKYPDDLYIEHIVTDPHSLQTIGQLERFNQTIKKELPAQRRSVSSEEAVKGIAEFGAFYNDERAHPGISGRCPADRFHGVFGERRRVKAELLSRMIDLSRGDVFCKFQRAHDTYRRFFESHTGFPGRRVGGADVGAGEEHMQR